MSRIIILFLILGLFYGPRFIQAGEGEFTKKPNVSGQFYSNDPKTLAKDIETFLDAARVEGSFGPIAMILVPHAGYVYSGAVAAYGYQAVQPFPYKTIVLIGPSHFSNIDGVAVWKEGAFETPLGTVAVDSDLAQKIIARNERFKFAPQAFAREHSLEVQIPFLQKTFKDFKIVPILMASHQFEDCQNLALALDSVIGQRNDILIVISTDLSHYHDAKTAEAMDKDSLEDVLKLRAKDLWRGNLARTKEMCGFMPATTAIIYAKLKNWTNVKLLKYAHSGHATGDFSTVVGYGAMAFYADIPRENQEGGSPMKWNSESLNQEQKKKLLWLARRSLESYVSDGKIMDVPKDDPRLLKEEGAFVTLHKNGELRGCIGRIVSDGPLSLTVRDMAIAAATEDPRFPPVKKEELPEVDLEISVLSKPRRTTNVEEITPGIHGVVIRRGMNGGVFLPQVATEFNWSREEFLTNLCAHKAGLSADCWKDPKTTSEIFTADVFSEKEFFGK